MQKRNQGPIGPSDSTGVLQKGPRDSANDGEDEDDLPMTILGKKRSYFQFDYCFKPQIRRIAQMNHKKKEKEKKIIEMKLVIGPQICFETECYHCSHIIGLCSIVCDSSESIFSVFHPLTKTGKNFLFYPSSSLAMYSVMRDIYDAGKVSLQR